MPPILISSLVTQQFPVTCGVQGPQEAKLWEETHSFCLCCCHISPCLLLVFSCSLTGLVKATEVGSQTFQVPRGRKCLPDVHAGVCGDAQVSGECLHSYKHINTCATGLVWEKPGKKSQICTMQLQKRRKESQFTFAVLINCLFQLMCEKFFSEVASSVLHCSKQLIFTWGPSYRMSCTTVLWQSGWEVSSYSTRNLRRIKAWILIPYPKKQTLAGS